jgi:LmbE family N-acetylglucosaminyl deacetylase
MPAPGTLAWESAVATVGDALRCFGPELALLPWRRDPHCDHRDSWLLSRHALRQAPVRPDTLEYAIWLDEFGEVEDHPKPREAERIRVNVGSALASKLAAIAAHESQTTDLIADDPAGFRLTPKTIARLTQSTEVFWRPINASH